jgi:hypothetical protein
LLFCQLLLIRAWACTLRLDIENRAWLMMRRQAIVRRMLCWLRTPFLLLDTNKLLWFFSRVVVLLTILPGYSLRLMIEVNLALRAGSLMRVLSPATSCACQIIRVLLMACTTTLLDRHWGHAFLALVLDSVRVFE